MKKAILYLCLITSVQIYSADKQISPYKEVGFLIGDTVLGMAAATLLMPEEKTDTILYNARAMAAYVIYGTTLVRAIGRSIRIMNSDDYKQ